VTITLEANKVNAIMAAVRSVCLHHKLLLCAFCRLGILAKVW